VASLSPGRVARPWGGHGLATGPRIPEKHQTGAVGRLSILRAAPVVGLEPLSVTFTRGGQRRVGSQAAGQRVPPGSLIGPVFSKA